MPALLPTTTFTAAVSALVGNAIQYFDGRPRNLLLQANFVYGSGGTSVDAWVQTTADGGATWTDIANFHFTTSSARLLYNLSSLTPKTTQVVPTDGSLASNTAVDGIFGSQLRVKYTSVGTYAGGTTMRVDAVTSRMMP